MHCQTQIKFTHSSSYSKCRYQQQILTEYWLTVTQLSRAEIVIANYSTAHISVMYNYQYRHRHKRMQVFYSLIDVLYLNVDKSFL